MGDQLAQQSICPAIKPADGMSSGGGRQSNGSMTGWRQATEDVQRMAIGSKTRWRRRCTTPASGLRLVTWCDRAVTGSYCAFICR